MAGHVSEDARRVIRELGLEPHPEGGYFRRVFPEEGDGTYGLSTIYYLLQGDDISAFHRLHGSTEIWYWHCGEELDIHVIDRTGNLRTHRLSMNASPQAVIGPDQWFAAEIPSGEGFALVGCAVSPAFSYGSFELADRQSLLQEFPQHADLISRLCRP